MASQNLPEPPWVAFRLPPVCLAEVGGGWLLVVDRRQAQLPHLEALVLSLAGPGGEAARLVLR